MYDYRCVAGKSESVLCIQESSDTAIKLKYEIIPETLCESTGLNDKNGKEIYVGDIVQCLEVSDHRTNEYISEVYEEECEILVHDSKYSDTPLAIFFPHKNQIPLTEIEIIGNIYDNPELLQEVDK
ncbi:hypothetical protein bsdcttw_46600 [Anaerocolumna chitinilytica]|uniref:YopX protein domain-containing protein n=2 Tax=Anaerocolumna chitinilytica TaxID=1727145 RepID=A0A7M3SAK2_9FIRM|nr:hypothetical protein bsdcttw_46600 [Anaerocolumna chitinilytica]